MVVIELHFVVASIDTAKWWLYLTNDGVILTHDHDVVISTNALKFLTSSLHAHTLIASVAIYTASVF